MRSSGSSPPGAIQSSAAKRDRAFHDLPGTAGIDADGLPAVAGHHIQCCGEGRTLDVDLQPVAAGEADGGSADVAGPLGPPAANPVAGVRREITRQIEIVAVAGAAQTQIDLVRAAATRPVAGVAAHALGLAALGAQGPGAGPVAAEPHEGARFGEGRRQAGEAPEGEQDRADAHGHA